MPDEEDVGVVDRQRVVDPEVVGRLGSIDAVAVGQPGVELACRAGCAALGEPLDVEAVDRHQEGVEVVGAEQAAGVEVVVGGAAVGELLALHEEHAALVAQQRADGEADEHHDHRQVEDQVADLPEVAALGAHRPRLGRVGGPQPVAAAAQHRAGLLDDLVDVALAGVRRVVGQAQQVARGGRRLGPHRAQVVQRARDDAADQRDHQQDVDRGEPRRVVDREQAEPLVDRRQRGVLVLPARHVERVDARLRDDRAGHGGQREQQQQDQRGAHRRQLAPGPAHQLAGTELPRAPFAAGVGAGTVLHVGHTATSNPPTSWICSHCTIQSHQPVTSRTPTTTSIAPPTRMTSSWRRRIQPSAPRLRL